MNTVVVIPARFASERLPGKPLLSETGKPLIQHVYEQVRRARLPDEVVVATDDRRIYDAVRRFGGKVVMTSREHASGTDRVAEAARGLPHAFVINVQGDEPEIEPALIDRLARTLKEDRKADWVTAARPLRGSRALAEPGVVKVVVDREGYALYFSRAVIPHDRARGIPARALVHVGIYGFRREALLRFARTPPSALERAERLEQLRALEHGQRIRVLETRRASRSIDTPGDYRRFVSRRLARR
jgi:3-deoxy-manno-octulosonate cytidylyltransferase (CMP-KDO synthetase)